MFSIFGFIATVLVGCEEKNNVNKLNYDEVQIPKTKIDKKKSDNDSVKNWDIVQYPRIKEVYDRFIETLNSNTVNYEKIIYKIDLYNNNKEYKTVKIVLNQNEEIIMKFSDDGDLLVLELSGSMSQNGSKDFENSKLSMVKFDYYNFNDTEVSNILNAMVKGEDYIIGNYTVTSSLSLNIFLITDRSKN